MKKQKSAQTVDQTKVATILTLFAIAALITALGVAFSIYSVINNIYFQVLTSSVHGAVFGAVIDFLGLRYCFAVNKLKAKVYETTSQFSWSNFKKTGTRFSSAGKRI